MHLGCGARRDPVLRVALEDFDALAGARLTPDAEKVVGDTELACARQHVVSLSYNQRKLGKKAMIYVF